uniref:ATP synthase complex subunit 8 n=1 Tax=Lucanus chengyuani TaxID=2735355 RepID=A0A6M4RHJ0_9SCAR|nr:ATP synthase F0 subunit 8 [Lucanus chengyuani]
MPQMAPLSWLTLMLTFIVTFLIFNTINFSINSKTSKSQTREMKTFHKSWKW